MNEKPVIRCMTFDGVKYFPVDDVLRYLDWLEANRT